MTSYPSLRIKPPKPLFQHHGNSHVSAYHLLAQWTVLTSRPVFYNSVLSVIVVISRAVMSVCARCAVSRAVISVCDRCD